MRNLLQQSLHRISILGRHAVIRISTGSSQRCAFDGVQAAIVRCDRVRVDCALRIHRGRTGDVYVFVGVACWYAGVQET